MSKNMTDRVDPELAGPLKMFLTMTGEGMDPHDIPAARAASSRMMTAMKGRLPIIEGVAAEDRRLPGPAGAPDVAVRVYQKTDRQDIQPALL